MKGLRKSLERRKKADNPPVPDVAIFQDSHDAYEVSWVVG